MLGFRDAISLSQARKWSNKSSWRINTTHLHCSARDSTRLVTDLHDDDVNGMKVEALQADQFEQTIQIGKWTD